MPVLNRGIGEDRALPTEAAGPLGTSGAGLPAAALPRRSVLHVFRYFRPDFTGEGLYVEKLARHLSALGIESDIVVSATCPPAPPPAGLAPMTGIGRVRFFGRPRQSDPTADPRLLAWLLRHVRDYDVVHLHAQVDRYFLVPLLARLAGRRVIQSCTLDDGLGRVIGSYRGWRRPIARMLCRAVQEVVAISPRLAEDSRRIVPAERVHLIPQGVDAPPEAPGGEGRAALRARLALAPGEVVLLFVGSLSRRKGVHELVANQLRLRESAPVRLLIVGPDLEDDYAAEVRRAAAASGSGIVFTGYTDDPLPYYRAADMFVFASHAEGFGNVLLEAMANGLPVVSRRLPGVTDWFIADGRTGLLFDTDEEYRAAVLRLAADPDLRARIGAAARTAALTDFGLPAIAARYAALYRA